MHGTNGIGALGADLGLMRQMEDTDHAAEHFPIFITQPGHTDVLLVITAIFLVAIVLMIGNLYFQLHALPERMSHKTNKLQLEIVAVLALISLFTHNHLFWIAGLLLAMVTIPDFTTPLNSISDSLRKLSGRGWPDSDVAVEAGSSDSRDLAEPTNPDAEKDA